MNEYILVRANLDEPVSIDWWWGSGIHHWGDRRTEWWASRKDFDKWMEVARELPGFADRPFTWDSSECLLRARLRGFDDCRNRKDYLTEEAWEFILDCAWDAPLAMTLECRREYYLGWVDAEGD